MIPNNHSMPEGEQPHNELERLHADIPQELQQYPNFVVWRYTNIEGYIRIFPIVTVLPEISLIYPSIFGKLRIYFGEYYVVLRSCIV